jgi:predicted RNA-binding Zn-ribbon protein involved in translation (DUF1610 family)
MKLGNEEETMSEQTSPPPHQPLSRDADAEARADGPDPADHSPLPPDLLGRTDVAGQTADDGKARVFPCQGCGANLQFHIGQQRLKCPYCGFEKDLEHHDDAEIREQDFLAMLDRIEQQRLQGEPEQVEACEVTCRSCGGTVVFTGTLTSSGCPYCGSPIQRENIHTATRRTPVDGVLPFLVDHKAAAQRLKSWVTSRWFAPNDFLEQGVQGKFNGVYLPYWTYDTLTFNVYSGERGEDYWETVGSGDNKRRVRRTRWYSASGRFQRFFDDVLVNATDGLPRSFILELEPWPLGKCLPFTQQILAGFLARTYDIELKDGFTDAKARIDAAITAETRSRIGGDRQRIHKLQTDYDAITFKHLLLPVWMLAYRYKDKPYRVFINAGTGEVQGERPYSWVKITLAVIAAAIAGLVLAILMGGR